MAAVSAVAENADVAEMASIAAAYVMAFISCSTFISAFISCSAFISAFIRCSAFILGSDAPF